VGGISVPDGHMHLIVGESLYLKEKVSEEISPPDGGGICSLNIGGSPEDKGI
jgi:hypothetical protein